MLTDGVKRPHTRWRRAFIDRNGKMLARAGRAYRCGDIAADVVRFQIMPDSFRNKDGIDLLMTVDEAVCMGEVLIYVAANELWGKSGGHLRKYYEHEA